MFTNLATGNLVPTNPLIANMGEPGLATEDITGATRTACGPDPGAYEFFVDHSISNFTFSGTNECGNYTEDITFDFNNGTAVDMEDVEVYYEVNGNRVTEYIADVAASSTETYTFMEAPVFNTPGVNTVMVGLGCDDNDANNTLSTNITITPSPYGADLVQGATFDGYWNTGNMADPHVTVKDEVCEFELVVPTKYASSGAYGTDWTATTNFMTSGGMTVGTTEGFTYTAPAGGNPGMVTVDPVNSLADSMVYVSLVINDLNTGCDSTIGQWMLIPHTPEPDFTFADVCLGDVAKFKNTSTMGGSDVLLSKWRYNDPNSDEDTAEIKDGFWLYEDYGTYDVTLETYNQAWPKFVYSTTKTITVTPTPALDWDIVNACEGVDIQFDNNTTLPIAGTITYMWNFGDGNTSTMEDPTHQYATPKAEGYPVTLVATANGCSSSETKTAYQFATPVAGFTADGLCNLEEIEFNNTTSLAIGKAGYSWDFGDNGVSTVANPVHTYSTSGTHTVTVTAYSEFGCTDSYTADVTLLESPEADFTYDATCNLTPVNFTRTGSVPSGVNSAFEWDFNGEAMSSDENPTHLFSEVGTKEVTLTITSLNGCMSEITKELDVVLQAVADFEVKDICEGSDAVFTNSSSVAAGDLTYTWLFGDGNTSNETSPRHEYATTGQTRIVNVTLIAEVDGGCNAQLSKPITINAAPDANFTITREGRYIYCDAPSGYTDYAWRFGDGGASSDEDPVYEYANVDNGSFEVCLSVKNTNCWADNCEMAVIDLVGVEELNKDDMINVYPNPTTGVFTLEVENVSDDMNITVTDLLGNVLSVEVTDNLNGSYVVDMSTVADGVYFVQVKNGDYYATKKVTVSK